jgi:hypothetical protein
MEAHPRQSFGRGSVRLWGPFALLCACALPVFSDQQAQVVVVSVTGDWRQVPEGALYDKQNRLRFGQILFVGQGCLLGKEGSIVLKYSTPSENALYPFPCEKPPDEGSRPCKEGPRNTCAVNLRELGTKKGLWNAFAATISSVTQNFSGQPERYMVASSRGGEAELVDAVVPLENGQIDLRGIFRDMSPGSYYVEFSAVEVAAFQGPPSLVSYAKGQPAFVPARGLRAGPYKVLLVDQKGESGDSDCWVLLAGAAEYATKAAAYERVVTESQKLPEEMDPAATRALLRAYLESLQAKQAVRP